MADKRENDFWGKSEDDFWNKPVITGNWLNSKNEQSENTGAQSSNENMANPYRDAGNPYADTGNPYTNRDDDRYESFYTDTASCQEQPRYGTPNQPAYTYQRNNKEQGRGQTTTRSPENKKKFPIFLVINLFFVAAALIVVGVCIFTASVYKKNAEYRNRQIDYESVVVEEDSFPVYDNNTITLAYEACVFFSPDTDKQLLGMPEGEMLIAVPVRVKSEKYEYGQYALRDMYIGCESGGQMVFRRCIRDETVLTVLRQIGFNQEEMFSPYGIGNGYDESGFFFFFVPENTESAVFYAEERKTEMQVSILTKRYEKKFAITAGTDQQEWLDEIRESEGWQ